MFIYIIFWNLQFSLQYVASVRPMVFYEELLYNIRNTLRGIPADLEKTSERLSVKDSKLYFFDYSLADCGRTQ